MTTMEPPESLLGDLERVPTPAPWLVHGGGVWSMLTETCTTQHVDSEHRVQLPLGELVRLRRRDECGPANLHIQLRLFPAWHLVAGREQILSIEDAEGESHRIWIEGGPGGCHLVGADSSQVHLADPGWLDVDIRANERGTQATVSHRGEVAHGFLEAMTSAPAALTIEPSCFDAARQLPCATVAARSVPVSDAPRRSVALSHLQAAIDRLDEGFDRWRSPNGPETSKRPIEVFAGLQRYMDRPLIPNGPLDLVGFLSEAWQRRLDAEEWSYSLRNGAIVDPAELDAYGRSGGLICYVYDRDWAMPNVAKTKPAPAPVSGPQVYGGSRESWMVGIRDTETMLLQFATVWYLTSQSLQPGDATETADTDMPEAATAVLGDALTELWHPTYAFHVDVVEVLAKGLGRFRFSDPDYIARSPLALTQMRDHLARTGVASRPVVLT